MQTLLGLIVTSYLALCQNQYEPLAIIPPPYVCHMMCRHWQDHHSLSHYQGQPSLLVPLLRLQQVS